MVLRKTALKSGRASANRRGDQRPAWRVYLDDPRFRVVVLLPVVLLCGLLVKGCYKPVFDPISDSRVIYASEPIEAPRFIQDRQIFTYTIQQAETIDDFVQRFNVQNPRLVCTSIEWTENGQCRAGWERVTLEVGTEVILDVKVLHAQ